MSLDLTAQQVDEIWMEAEQQCPPITSIDYQETIYNVPNLLGSGYNREMEIYPGLELCIFNKTYHDLTQQVPENSHLVQFAVYLSGVIDTDDLVSIDAEQSYVDGSGIQRSHQMFRPHWSQLKAVQNNQVYRVNWTVGEPIGANRVIDNLYKYVGQQTLNWCSNTLPLSVNSITIFLKNN